MELVGARRGSVGVEAEGALIRTVLCAFGYRQTDAGSSSERLS